MLSPKIRSLSFSRATCNRAHAASSLCKEEATQPWSRAQRRVVDERLAELVNRDVATRVNVNRGEDLAHKLIAIRVAREAIAQLLLGDLTVAVDVKARAAGGSECP